MHDNDWQENANLVLFRLDNLDRKMDKISDELNIVKTKVAVWGFVAGLIPGGFMILVEWIIRR